MEQRGRSVNLALSVRGIESLRAVGAEGPVKHYFLHSEFNLIKIYYIHKKEYAKSDSITANQLVFELACEQVLCVKKRGREGEPAIRLAFENKPEQCTCIYMWLNVI